MRIGKSILGALIGGFGFISRPEVLNILPERWALAVTTVGGVLGVIGFRHAIEKATGK